MKPYAAAIKRSCSLILLLEEIEAGYIYKDKVIKHAKVVVSQEVEEQEDSINSENGNEE